MRGLMSPAADFCVTVQIGLLVAVTWEAGQGSATAAAGGLESNQQLYDEESNHLGVWSGESSGFYDDVRRTNTSHEWCPMPCVCPLASSTSLTVEGGSSGGEGGGGGDGGAGGGGGHPQLRCKGGVSIVRDGCGCCFVCARQQGDLCDFRNRCDEDKLMRCDYTASSAMTTMSGATSATESTGRWTGAGGGGTMDGDGGGGAAAGAVAAATAKPLPPKGICRAKIAKPCDVNGKVYQDGEHFRLNCSQLCTCQNGHYACASLCPQEDVAPSGGHCRHPQLTSIGGRCCKEWICPHSQSQMRPDDEHGGFGSSYVSSGVAIKDGRCAKETTGWSACSVTCDFGWSIRLTNENKQCIHVQQRRLCIVRPCQLKDKHVQGRDCKSTWRQDDPMRVSHGDCVSVKEFRPKYCSTCKRQRCCRPDLSKTLTIEMNCSPNNRTTVEKFMWIKSCRCRAVYC